MLISSRSFDSPTIQLQEKTSMKRFLALPILLLAFVATNAFAVGEARLSGKVFDGSTKKPIPNATILVTSAPGSGKNFKQEFKAKADGSYAIFLLDGTIK